MMEKRKITKKCPRCGGILCKSSKKDFAYYCLSCNEYFYSFECMGEVICTNELMSKMKQTNIDKKDKDFILPDEIDLQRDQQLKNS